MLLHAAAKGKLQSLTAASFPSRGGWESFSDGNNFMNANKMTLSRSGATQTAVTRAMLGCDMRHLDPYL